MDFMPDLLEKILGNCCGLCGKKEAQASSLVSPFCNPCAEMAAALLIKDRPMSVLIGSASDQLRVHYFFDYKNLGKIWIKHNKTAQNKNAIRFFTSLLGSALRKHFQRIPLLWVPSHPMKKLHFVEKIILELDRIKVPVVARLPVKKRFLSIFDDQKSKKINERNKTRAFARKPRELPKRIILFDDVCTTGGTLLANKRLIESDDTTTVVCAFVLAHTPRENLHPKRFRAR